MRGRATYLLVIALLASCSPRQPDDPAAVRQAAIPLDAPMSYHGKTLYFPLATVEARFDEPKKWPWARLMPDAPREGDSVNARYYIDLGRPSTGTTGELTMAMWLGYNSYADDAIITLLPDGYKMWCSPPQRATPAFDCAVLLKALPLAAIAIRDRPTAANAYALVQDAERYLTRVTAK